jgi:hypothetical protein
LLPLCLYPCPNPTFHNIFVLISPPLSSISTKGVHLLIQRVALEIVVDTWILHFFGHHLYSSLDICVGSCDLDTNCSGAPPPLSKHGS